MVTEHATHAFVIKSRPIGLHGVIADRLFAHLVRQTNTDLTEAPHEPTIRSALLKPALADSFNTAKRGDLC